MTVQARSMTRIWLGGEELAYPGHPLVLATLVMSFFESHGEASKLTAHGWEEAVGDVRIPGAGDQVTAAMHVLKMAAQGATPDEVVLAANDYWIAGRAGGHVKKLEVGAEQSRLVEPIFREKLAAWDFSRAPTSCA